MSFIDAGLKYKNFNFSLKIITYLFLKEEYSLFDNQNFLMYLLKKYIDIVCFQYNL